MASARTLASAEYQRRYRAANREELNRKQREQYVRTAEKRRAQGRAYYARHREERVIQQRERVKRDPEKQQRINWKSKGTPMPTRPKPLICECCGALPGKISLCADHDHLAHEFRGWLCTCCNKAIGMLGDTVVGVQRAITYLKRWLETR